MDYVHWWNILCPFALGFFVVFYYRKYRYQKRRAETFKEKLGEYVKASVKLSHDLEICKARNSSLKQDLIRARDEGGLFTREANRMGQDVFQMNRQIADLKEQNKKLLKEIIYLEKQIPTGETGI
jgi:predicted nuclease with TOPRIM domain